MKKRALMGLVSILVLAVWPVEEGMAVDIGVVRGGVSQSASPDTVLGTWHDVGNIELMVSNVGVIGSGFWPYMIPPPTPPVSCDFPKGTGLTYLFGGSLWIGAVVGRDTLVSTGNDGWVGLMEMYPDDNATILRRSTLSTDANEATEAVSHLDLIAVYTDTFPTGTTPYPDPEDNNRPHIPLPVEITQRSCSWAYSHAEDVILFEMGIKNIGDVNLKSVYIGWYVDGDVFGPATAGEGYDDDITGFLPTAELPFGACTFRDYVRIAWIADNDGDLSIAPPRKPVPSVTGISVISYPTDTARSNFNWWVSNGNSALDFGPRHKDLVGGYFYRDFGTGGTGTPSGDRNKYYVLRHPEFDYDQVFTASILPSDPVWLTPPAALAPDLADGFDTRYLLSMGPFDLAPGATVPLVFAYMGGEGFHTDPANIQNLPNDPSQFTANLNFNDLAVNRQMAAWIYDNPGVDSDSDGYAGRWRLCAGGDTVWYRGDGIPDWKAAWPPPAPKVWVEERPGGIYVRFNGLKCETARDPVMQREDFEGYRVYLRPDSGTARWAIVADYDVEDYFRWLYDPASDQWLPDRIGRPYSRAELACAYGMPPNPCWDISFDPSEYSGPESALVHVDTLMYFTPALANHSEFGGERSIRKRYPLALPPSTLNPWEADPSELTDDGYFKFYEYELELTRLSAGRRYCASVTAIDNGSSRTEVYPLESDKLLTAQCVGTGPALVKTVFWPAEAGGNDHWYGIHAVQSTWYDARDIAMTLEYEGLPGHLVSITSVEENQLIVDSLFTGYPMPNQNQAWIGAHRTGGNWAWLTGEPFFYSNWFSGSGEPGDDPAQSAALMKGWIQYPYPGGPESGVWYSFAPDDSLHPAYMNWSVVEFEMPPPGDTVIPTNAWINVYCGNPTLNGEPLAPGTIIRAYANRRLVCGIDTVEADGSYGFMPIYWDDPFTPRQEGMLPGDTVLFRVGDQFVLPSEPVVWTENGDSYEVCEFNDCRDLVLRPGWNLISWNRQYEGSIEDFLARLWPTGLVDVVLGFDGGAQTYDPDLPQFSTLSSVDYYHGYWVRVQDGCHVNVCGPAPGSYSGIRLTPGWNLAAYWPEESYLPQVALGSITPNVVVALGFDSLGAQIWLPGDPASNLGEMRPGLGYWLKMATGDWLVYPGWIDSMFYEGDGPRDVKRSESAVIPSRDWMSVYGEGVMLDGEPLAEEAVIEVVTADGIVCGRGVYSGGLLKFMPIYAADGDDPVTAGYPVVGGTVGLRVDGMPVSLELTMQGQGERVRLTNLATASGMLPVRYALYPNYPNPFNPSTTIRFSLPVTGPVRLCIYNIAGQLVTTLADGVFEAGTHDVMWNAAAADGTPAASGVYLYRLEAGAYVESRKMTLIK